MRKPSPGNSIYCLVSTLAFTCSVSAHSWIEYALRIAPNGTLVGEKGFPRGYVPRGQAGFNDKIPQNILPTAGQPAYSGQEILNKFPFEANPKQPMLQASPGEHIAIIHLENGHVSLPQNQPKKPHNRGTIFLYGTSEPKEKEKLFDVHLRWNKDGTGGDKRGILLGTKNYDDGQCFQPNPQQITKERASKFSSSGAKDTQELPCQSDIKLPDKLKPGSVYTIYWYWDWPDLNDAKINMEKTKDGSFPWAGSFMRGDAIPNGWTMDMIARNESYSSVIDIKIVDAGPQGFAAKDNKEKWVAQQNIYSKAIEEQMKSNFQVNVGDMGGPGGAGGASGPALDKSPPPPASSPPPAGPAPTSAAASQAPPPPAPTSGAGNGVTTVTRVVTVPPTTVLKTVVHTVNPVGQAATQPPQSETTVTVTTHVPPPNGAYVKRETKVTAAPNQKGGTPINRAAVTVTRFKRRMARRSAFHRF